MYDLREGSPMRDIGWLIDGSIVFFLFLQTFIGYRRGLLWQAAGVASVGFGIALGCLFAPKLSDYFLDYVTSNTFHAKLVAYLAILGLVGFVMRMVAAVAEVRAENGLPREERERRRTDDRILGGIFGAVKGSVLALVIVAVSTALFPASSIWKHSTLANPMAVAGSRLLPEGAVKEVKCWAAQSASNFKQGLDIR
jgi:uncharacterized membrane protein required for colicin V production